MATFSCIVSLIKKEYLSRNTTVAFIVRIVIAIAEPAVCDGRFAF